MWQIIALHDKEFNDAKNRKYNGYQRGIASMVYNFFDKKVSGKGIENEDILDQQSAENLYKPITRKFKIQEKKKYTHLLQIIFRAQN